MSTIEGLSLTETIDNKRYYNIIDKENNKHKLPSVTTILGTMTDNSALDAWRKRIGEAEAERISKFGRNRGSIMHQKLEWWFTSDIEDQQKRMESVNEQMRAFVKSEGYTEEELKCGTMLFDKLRICGFFNRVESIIEMEQTLFSLKNGGFAGRVDCIYMNKQGERVLLDFKTARHKKRRDWITSYFMQLSAYFLAYYEMYGIVLDKAELWIAVEDDAPQLIEITKEELKEWLKYFLNYVKLYHEKYGYLLTPVEKKIQKNETTKIGKITVRHLI